MKKMIISLFCILIMIYMIIVPKVNALDGVRANIKFSGNYNDDVVIISIEAGKFTGFTSGGVVNASMTLDYDSNIVTKVEVESYNNWKIELAEKTKRVLISTDESKDNVQIAKITVHLNKGKLNNKEQKVSIKEFEIANGSELNEVYPEYNYKFTPENSTEDGKNENLNTNTNQNTIQNVINSNNISINTDSKKNTITGNKQNTLAPTKLPAAGIKNIIILSIVIIAIATIIFKIKSRKIKY